MNISTVSFLDLTQDKNGVTSVANDLNQLLESAGDQIRIVTPTAILDSRSAGAALKASRLARRIHRSTGSAFSFLGSLYITALALQRHMTANGALCDAVIAHDPISAGAALRASGGRYPVLLICHFWTEPWTEFSDAGLVPEHSRAFRFLRRWMERILNSPGLTLVAVSQRNAALLRRIAPGSAERIHVAYPGVNRPAASDQIRPATVQPPVIINVGKMEKRKNQRILPDVAAELVRRGFPCRFMLVGPQEADEKAYILDKADSLGVGELITMTGSLERTEVVQLMQGADLYLHTSLMESFGMTLVEAMAAGTPAMALEYEALHEILPDTPEMVIPATATPQEIADLLIQLFADRQRLAGIRIRQSMVFEQRFSSQAFLSRIRDIISAAGGRNG
jgi:glycosyltransferase involved in cell wall biosynthesis